jgi:hypothetical protein
MCVEVRFTYLYVFGPISVIQRKFLLDVKNNSTDSMPLCVTAGKYSLMLCLLLNAVRLSRGIFGQSVDQSLGTSWQVASIQGTTR